MRGIAILFGFFILFDIGIFWIFIVLGAVTFLIILLQIII
jgi:hypothetical protein